MPALKVVIKSVWSDRTHSVDGLRKLCDMDVNQETTSAYIVSQDSIENHHAIPKMFLGRSFKYFLFNTVVYQGQLQIR